MKTARDHADKCLLCSLEAFTSKLQAWLDAGGDDRLVEFEPLEDFTKVLRHLSAMQKRGETQHAH